MSATRERLAEALRDWGSLPDAYACLPYVQREAVLDALLPVVESLADERAAESLDRVAAVVRAVHRDLGPKADLWAVANGIERDAAALRAPSREETQ